MPRNSITQVHKGNNSNNNPTIASAAGGLLERLQKFEQRCSQILEPSNRQLPIPFISGAANGSISPQKNTQEIQFEDRQIYARRQIVGSPANKVTINGNSSSVNKPSTIRQQQSLWNGVTSGNNAVSYGKKPAIERQNSMSYIQKLQQNHARMQNQQQLQLENTLFKQAYDSSPSISEYPLSSNPLKLQIKSPVDPLKQFTALNVEKKISIERASVGVPIIKLRESTGLLTNSMTGSSSTTNTNNSVFQTFPLKHAGNVSNNTNYYYQSIHKKQLTGGTRIVKINKKRREVKHSNLCCGDCVVSLDSQRQNGRIFKEGEDGVMYRVWQDRQIEDGNGIAEESNNSIPIRQQSKKVNVQYLIQTQKNNQDENNNNNNYNNNNIDDSLHQIISGIALFPKAQESNNLHAYQQVNNIQNTSNIADGSPQHEKLCNQQSYQRSVTDYNTNPVKNTNMNSKTKQQQQQYKMVRAKDDFDKESVKKMFCLFSQQIQRPMSSQNPSNHAQQQQQQQLLLSQPCQLAPSSEYPLLDPTSAILGSTQFASLSNLNSSDNQQLLSNQLRYMNQISKNQLSNSALHQQQAQLFSSQSTVFIPKTDAERRQFQMTVSSIIQETNPSKKNQVTGRLLISRPMSHKETIKEKESLEEGNAIVAGTAVVQQNNQKNNKSKVIAKQQTVQVVPAANRPTQAATKAAQQQAKQDNFRDFLNIINYSNNLISPCVLSNPTPPAYKVYIGLGNNGIVVRQIFKTRWWWQLVEDKEEWSDCQFLWMQWRRKEYTKYMKSLAQLQIDRVIASSPREKDNGVVEGQGTAVVVKKKTALEYSRKKGETYQKLTRRLLNDNDFQLIDQNLVQNKRAFVPPLISKAYCNEKFCEDNKSAKAITKLKDPSNYKLHNHVQGNFHICNKKALFYNMRSYYSIMNKDPFEFIPLTFHIREGINDKEWDRFLAYFNQLEQQIIENEKLKQKIEVEKLIQQEKPKVIRNIWIIKPGETTNRGNGIQVSQEKKAIQDIVSTKEVHANGKSKTFIIQKYLDKPLLYKMRKFDIRCYMLITTYNGIIKGYWYQDGYIRTSSKEFSVRNLDNKFIHLTNDAIQKKGEEFGKFEIGNKLSYNEFQRYMDSQTQGTSSNTSGSNNNTNNNNPGSTAGVKYNFMEMTYQDMRNVATDCVKAIFKKLEPQKKQFSFELFGLDFMIDESYKTWLIEVNTNPCLETTCPLLDRVITGLLDNLFKLAVDPIFPPPSFPKTKKHLVPENIFESNKFELIFDELVDGPKLECLPSKVEEIQEEDWEEEEQVEQELLAGEDE